MVEGDFDGGTDKVKLSKEDIHRYSKKISFDAVQYSRLKDSNSKDSKRDRKD